MGRVLINTVKTFVTVGYPKKVTRRERKVVQQDGYVSSLLYFLLLLSCGIALSTTRWLTTDQSQPVTRFVVASAFSLPLALSIVCLWILIYRSPLRYRVSKRIEDPFDEGSASNSNSGNWKKRSQLWLPLVGLFIFMLGFLALDVVNCAAVFSCINEYATHSTSALKDAIAVIVYRLFRLIFILLISVFICVYHTAKLRLVNRCWLRYVLVTFAAILIWMYVDIQLYLAQNLFAVHQPYGEMCSHERSNLTYAQQCLCEETGLFELYVTAGDYFFPFILGFCLIGTQCVIQMFVTMVPEKTLDFQIEEFDPTHRNQQLENDPSACEQDINENDMPEEPRTVSAQSLTRRRFVSATSSEYDCFSETDSEESNSEEDCLPLCTNALHRFTSHFPCAKRKQKEEMSPDLDDISPTNHDIPPSEQMVSVSNEYENLRTYGSISSISQISSISSYEVSDRRAKCSPILIVGLILTLLFIISAVCTVKEMDKKRSDNMKLFYNAMKLIYWFAGIVVIWVGFVVSRNFRTRHTGYTGFTILLLISSFAVFIFNAFSFQAGIGALLHSHQIGNVTDTLKNSKCIEENLINLVFMFIDVIVNCAQVYIQTSFIFHVMHLDSRSVKFTKPRDYRLYKMILIYLMQFNLAMWIFVTFILAKNSESLDCYIMRYLTHDSWHIIAHLVQPVGIFYRYQSFILFTMFYLKT